MVLAPPRTWWTPHSGGAFPAVAHEQALDKLTMLVQQQSEEIGRSLRLPVSSPLSGISMPEPGAGGLIRWTAGGTALETAGIGDLSLDIAAEIDSAAAGDRLVHDGAVWRNRPPGQRDVREFGAAGDGSTDDTAALQTALDTGDALFFPAGTYKIMSTLSYTENGTLSLTGAGRGRSIIRAVGNIGGISVPSATAAHIVGLQIVRDPDLYTGAQNGIDIADASYSYIAGNAVQGFDKNIRLNGGYFVHVLDNIATQYFSRGIECLFGAQVSDLDIRGNHVNHARNGAAIGIYCTGQDVDISHNSLEDYGDQGIYLATQGGVAAAQICNNRFTDGTYAGEMIAISASGRGIVSGNVSTGQTLADKDGIRFVNSSSSANWVCSGNLIFQSTRHGILVEANANNIVLADNQVYQPSQHAVLVAGGAVQVSGLYVNGANTANTLSGADAAALKFSSGSASSCGFDNIHVTNSANLTSLVRIATGNSATAGSVWCDPTTAAVIDRLVTYPSTGSPQYLPRPEVPLYSANQTGAPVLCLTQQGDSVATSGTTAEDLRSFTLKAGAMGANASENFAIEIEAWGTFASNANTKTVQIKLGSNVLCYNDVTTAPNGVNWHAKAKLSKRSTGSSVFSLGVMTVGAVPQTIQQGGPAFTHGSDNTITVTVTTPSASGDASVRELCIRYYSEPS